MRITVFTLFPEMFAGPFAASIVARAVERRLLRIEVLNFRDQAQDRHRTVDDYPYGGGPGMVLQPGPLFAAVEAAALTPATPVVLLSPQGRPFDQGMAGRFAAGNGLALICGHYEGIDERVHEHLATEEVSLGDFVLSGGEIAAMAIVDAVARLIPGVIDAASIGEESFEGQLLEYPQYSRPVEFRGWRVPEILLSGNHAAIARWRRAQALRRTWLRRPDLLARARLTAAERQAVAAWNAERAGPTPAPV